MITLENYIFWEYNGNRTKFAAANGVSKQVVNSWLNHKYKVYRNQLVAIKRDIK